MKSTWLAAASRPAGAQAAALQAVTRAPAVGGAVPCNGPQNSEPLA
jgi:hypothetical protein